MRSAQLFAVVCLLLGSVSVAGADEHLDARDIAKRSDAVLRADTTMMAVRMTVKSPRLSGDRKVAFHSWEDRRRDRSFIRILSPTKDAGTGFLRLPPNLWTYIPRVERSMRIPPSMMLQPWMGSDFTNDDLVNESSDVDDYDHTLLRVEKDADGRPGLRAYVVQYVPHEDVAVVWGRIEGWIEAEHYWPMRQDFYDEDGVRVRTLRYDDVREVEGRHVPHRWVMTPLEKKGHETRIELESIAFDPVIDPGVFTTRNLKQR